MSEIKQQAIRAIDLKTIDNVEDNNFIGQIAGYAIVFSKPSIDIGMIEYIEPQALNNVDLSKVLALYNHDFGNVLGRVDSGTLKLSVDETGLYFVLNIPDTTVGHDVYTNIKAGNLQGMSFGFSVAKNGDSVARQNGKVIRHVNNIDQINEISVVSVPAYEDTAVQVTRSAEQKEDEVMNEQNVNNQQKTDDMKELLQVVKELKTDLEAFKKTDESNKMNPTTNVATPLEEERSALNAYFHSMGQIRDGLTPTKKGVLIPEEIIYNQEYEVNTVNDLASMVAKTTVTSANGKYPILKHPDTTLPSVVELAENPNLANPQFKQIDWNVQTYRGTVPVSQESIADSAIDLTSLVVRYINNIKLNTTNAAIAKVLTEFKKEALSEETLLDDLKKIINTGFDTAYNLSIVLTASLFNKLDTVKDSQGRYLLQDQIGTKTERTLFGLKFVVVEDTAFGGKAGSKQAFIGDLQRAVLFADRVSADVHWSDDYIYGKVLQAVIRFDVKQADENAGQFIELNDTPTQ